MVLPALICLLMLASAVPYSVTAGPYNISFDLGIPHSSYQVTTNIRNETKSSDYFVVINELKSDRSVIIYTTKYAEKQDTTSLSASSMEKTLNALFPSYIEVSSRIIDDKIGVVAKSPKIPETSYNALYYPDEYSYTMIWSTYPWDEGTLQLLDTIHIERTNATS
jgi:hypothetical protein